MPKEYDTKTAYTAPSITKGDGTSEVKRHWLLKWTQKIKKAKFKTKSVDEHRIRSSSKFPLDRF